MIKYLIGAILLIGLGYGALEAWPLLAGPSIVVTAPADNEVFPGGIVEVAGRALRVAELTLNGAVLLRDQEGNFSSTLTLARGGSILTFVATDQFGRKVSATRTVLVP